MRDQKTIAAERMSNDHGPKKVAMTRMTLLIVAALAVVAPQLSSTNEAYAIYSMLIAQEPPMRAKAQQLVLINMTTTNRTTQGCVPSGKALETDWKPVVEDFNRQNASPQRLSANLQLDVPYILVERDRVDRLFNVDGLGGWGRFYTLYPNSGGYIEVSAVGFDEAKTRAMVYVAHHCGGLCGAGTYHFLEKTDEAWRPATLDIKNCRWVS